MAQLKFAFYTIFTLFIFWMTLLVFFIVSPPSVYPQDGQGVWTKDAGDMGQIWDIKINPLNQQIMYAASNSNGMYKSVNGGQSWSQINSGLNNLVVQCCAISKSNPN